MTKSRTFVILRMMIGMAFLLVLAATPAAAQQELPHSFYGPVSINGVAAPVGAVISAQTTGGGAATGIVGNPLTTTTVGQYGGPNVVDPKLVVQGPIDAGEAILFYVNGAQAQVRVVGQTTWLASFPWSSGALTNLELNATGEEPSPTPTVTPSPTPTATPDPGCLDPAGFQVILGEGWSLFSTPVKLAAGSEQLAQIFDAGGGAQIFLRWDGQAKQFEQVLGTYVLQPLDAIYVRVAAGQTATATLIPSTQLSGIPSRTLYTGVNLVGPSPAFDGCRFPDMAVEAALASAAQAPGGLTGYTQVVSPAHNQTGWVYAPGMDSQMMEPFKGYWVLMENDDELFGFGTTPL
jgi:hypothetical protein